MRGQASSPETHLGPGDAQPQVQGRQEDPDHEHQEVAEGPRRLSSPPDLDQHVGMLGSVRQCARQVAERGNMFCLTLKPRDRL